MSTSVTVVFGQNNFLTKIDAQFTSDARVSISDLSDLRTNAATEFPISTWEPDYWLLDGNYKFAKFDAPVSHIGLMSLGISDAAGATAFTLNIDFDDVHSTIGGLTLRGNEISDDYASDITISYYDAANVLIRSDNYLPSSWQFRTNQAVSNFKKIVIQFNKTNKPFRHVRLIGIDFDDLISFSGSDVISAQLVEQINVLSIELPYNTLELTLHSDDEDFSIVAPAGFYATLQHREPLEVYETVDGTTIFLGRFYLDTWESKSANIATFRAMDAVGLMEQNTYLGGFFSGLLIDLIDDLFTEVDLDYDLHVLWDPYGFTGWLPIMTFRQTLQHIAFANGLDTVAMTITCARSAEVKILYFFFAPDVVDYGYTLTEDDVKIESLTLKTAVTATEATKYDWSTSPDPEEIFSNTLAAGNQLIVLEGAPWNTGTFGTTGATLIELNSNYVLVNVASPGTVSVTGNRIILAGHVHTEPNPDVAAGTKPYVVSIDSVPSVAQNVGVAEAMLNYYRMRYLLKVKVFKPEFTVGDAVIVPVQGRQFGGIVERMETDLAGGFVSRVTMTGVILEES